MFVTWSFQLYSYVVTTPFGSVRLVFLPTRSYSNAVLPFNGSTMFVMFPVASY